MCVTGARGAEVSFKRWPIAMTFPQHDGHEATEARRKRLQEPQRSIKAVALDVLAYNINRQAGS